MQNFHILELFSWPRLKFPVSCVPKIYFFLTQAVFYTDEEGKYLSLGNVSNCDGSEKEQGAVANQRCYYLV